jgi:predicted nucleic acid-binding protein
VIFVDTGAWFAVTVPSDPHYHVGSRWFNQNSERLLTTDYVVDETPTVLRSRGEHQRALMMGGRFFSGELTAIYFLTEADIREAWQTFLRYDDKEWSFTDCTSKVVMEKLGITVAFAFDQHFRRFGSVTVAP